MCAIYGYLAKSKSSNTESKIIDGLKRMEYRGYDSWGVASIVGSKINIQKEVGSISEAKIEENKITLGIGHTRWATHGGVTKINAHPHLSTDERFALAQNGIVENFQDLKTDLLANGYEFKSETDTEVIVRLIERENELNNNFGDAVKSAFTKLEGRNTIVVLNKEINTLIGVRNGSPLIVAKNDDEYYLASDTLSVADSAAEYIVLDNNEGVCINEDKIEFFDAVNTNNIDKKFQKLEKGFEKVDLDGFDHFMIKEINEQAEVLHHVIDQDEEVLKDFIEKLKIADTVYVTGAGTAYHASQLISYYLRTIGKIKSFDLRSYDSLSYIPNFNKNDLLIVVSQSGETADTIETLEFAKTKGVQIASIVNMVGSTISRMSDYAFFTKSGPEIAVASTKAYTAQSTWGYFIAKTIIGERETAEKEINKAEEQLKNVLNKDNLTWYRKIAKELKGTEHMFVLGKGANTSTALEAALKIKEIPYKHLEGFTAGELKHGVIALIEEGTPVFVIVSEDEFKNDMISAAAEVKARGAKVFAVAKEQNEIFDECITLPFSEELDPVVNIVPFQLISYYLAVELGFKPDKPRNLAKSVTVK